MHCTHANSARASRSSPERARIFIRARPSAPKMHVCMRRAYTYSRTAVARVCSFKRPNSGGRCPRSSSFRGASAPAAPPLPTPVCLYIAVSTVPVPGLRKIALAVPEPALERCLGHGWLGYLPERWRWNRQALAASFYVGNPFHRLTKGEDKKSRLRIALHYQTQPYV